MTTSTTCKCGCDYSMENFSSCPVCFPDDCQYYKSEGGDKMGKRVTPEEIQDILKEVLGKLSGIMLKKCHDYTSGSNDALANFRMSEFVGVSPAKGILIRKLDKMARIKSFDEQGTLLVDNESAEDALLDDIGYSVLLIGLLREGSTKKEDDV